MSTIKRLALTAGEPAGVGPDLCIMLAQQQQQSELVVIADPVLLVQRAKQLNLNIKLELVDLKKPASIVAAGILRYLPCQLAQPVIAGELNPANAHYVLHSLQAAATGAIEKQFDAVVTAPVHKGVINDAAISFSGHTEFFAERAAVDKVVMMLATNKLRVALATTHLPLSQVSQTISQSSIRRVIEIIDQALREQFSIPRPRIAVCGLNPHAGEGGHLGNEEQQIIEPVLAELVARGLAVSGPWPADTIFVADRVKDYDVVLAMYHDQGLPVLKQQGFGEAVNITLGLPFIRTSVDHGTALDLAATGKAKMTSLQAAVAMAEYMSGQAIN